MSKWRIDSSIKIALGEQQMDGGVGGRPTDPRADEQPFGEHPLDAAEQSPDQERAEENWGSIVSQILEEDKSIMSEEDLIRILQDKGCPDPHVAIDEYFQLLSEGANTPADDGPAALSEQQPIEQPPQQMGMQEPIMASKTADFDDEDPQFYNQEEDEDRPSGEELVKMVHDITDELGRTMNPLSADGLTAVLDTLVKMGCQKYEAVNAIMEFCEAQGTVLDDQTVAALNEWEPELSDEDFDVSPFEVPEPDGPPELGDRVDLSQQERLDPKSLEDPFGVGPNKVPGRDVPRPLQNPFDNSLDWQGAKGASAQYPENSEKNAPDHSAPGHSLPKSVNSIYNAVMREHPEYGKEKAMKIAWERSGEKHEKGGDKPKRKSYLYNGVEGRVTDRWRDMYGQQMVRFSTGEEIIEVPESHIETGEADIVPGHDVLSEVEGFMNSIEQVDRTSTASVRARIANLENVIEYTGAVVKTGSVPVSAQMRLDEINTACLLEVYTLKQDLRSSVSAEDRSYFSGLPKFEVRAYAQADLGHKGNGEWVESAYQDLESDKSGTDWRKVATEDSRLFVQDLPPDVLSDTGSVRSLALREIGRRTAGLADASAITKEYLACAESARRDLLAHRKTEIKKAASLNLDGPDDRMFL